MTAQTAKILVVFLFAWTLVSAGGCCGRKDKKLLQNDSQSPPKKTKKAFNIFKPSTWSWFQNKNKTSKVNKKEMENMFKITKDNEAHMQEPNAFVNGRTSTKNSEVQMMEEVRNDYGVLIRKGNGSGKNKWYCGRYSGRAIPWSDGCCGPNNGPQCPSCSRTKPRKDLEVSEAHNGRTATKNVEDLENEMKNIKKITTEFKTEHLVQMQSYNNVALLIDGFEHYNKAFNEYKKRLEDHMKEFKKAALAYNQVIDEENLDYDLPLGAKVTNTYQEAMRIYNASNKMNSVLLYKKKELADKKLEELAVKNMVKE